MKILIADDDSVSRRVMERLLCKVGYSVVVAKDGRQALDVLLSSDCPRLALLDWMMPGLDGPSVCLEVRNRREQPYTYIILLTSKGATEDLIAGLDAGADDYLTKPCNMQELKARLRTGERVLRLEETLVASREEMRFKANHDALTSLWNRGAILAQLDEKFRGTRRDETRFSLLLCDVDHFKQINDVHGHLAGDLVLREIAARIAGAIRPDDAVGRYGGEEILVILYECGSEGLFRRADEVRQAVASLSFSGKLQSLRVSISIGAMAVEGDALELSLEACLSQVDAALYEAKMQGRDRVVVVESNVLELRGKGEAL